MEIHFASDIVVIRIMSPIITHPVYHVFSTEDNAAKFLFDSGYHVVSHEPSPSAYVYGPSEETAHRLADRSGLQWTRVLDNLLERVKDVALQDGASK